MLPDQEKIIPHTKALRSCTQPNLEHLETQQIPQLYLLSFKQFTKN